jgi:hypothetical protein
MNRRAFLERTVIAGAGAVSAALFESCKANPTTPDDPDLPPVPVNLQFEVYNHTQGLKASFSKSGIMSETRLALTASGLISEYGIEHVVSNKLALRGEDFGGLFFYAKEGSVTVSVPRSDTKFSIFLFNDAGEALYNWYDTFKTRGIMYDHNVLAFYRKDYDGLTGEERVWGGELLAETGGYGVFDQINAALQPEWATFKYGHFERRPTSTTGDSSYGYGNAYGREFWKVSNEFVMVNPTLLTTIPQQVAGGIAAVIESLMGLENLGGDATYMPIQNNGVLNQAGKDIISFMFVRDPAAQNF